MSPTATTLPAPTFRAETCAAGGDGVEGCRACVSACPQHALSARPVPHGIEIAVDDHACVRCGLCTSVCPTSSLQRAFLPDDELRAAIVAAVAPGRPLLVIGDHHDHEIARAERDEWGVLALPSVLIMDVTAFLVAHRAGASAVVVTGCTDCHRDALDRLEAAAAAAGELAGRPGRTVMASVAAEAMAGLGALVDRRAGS
ncbi:MAG: 4Fe-4S dicluster domain-containing protein, partial [Ilumatobacteraceae bacterium]